MRPWLIVLLGAALVIPATAQNEAPASPPSGPPPAPPEARQFDFWIGDWEVRTPDGKLAGYNRIESILNGRVVQENYTTPGAYAGHSFNIYNAPAGRWEQYWVDVTGLSLHLKGGLNDAGQMVLRGERLTPAGDTVIDRITWTPRDDGTVRQFWEMSTDGGETWSVAFDGIYRPRDE